MILRDTYIWKFEMIALSVIGNRKNSYFVPEDMTLNLESFRQKIPLVA